MVERLSDGLVRTLGKFTKVETLNVPLPATYGYPLAPRVDRAATVAVPRVLVSRDTGATNHPSVRLTHRVLIQGN